MKFRSVLVKDFVKQSEADTKGQNMDEKESQKQILEFLENSYTGATALDHFETVVKLARTIAAFKSDPFEEIFTEEFKEKFYTEET